MPSPVCLATTKPLEEGRWIESDMFGLLDGSLGTQSRVGRGLLKLFVGLAKALRLLDSADSVVSTDVGASAKSKIL